MHFFNQNKKIGKHFISLLSVAILVGACVWGGTSRSVFAQTISTNTTATAGAGNEKQISASAILLDGKGSPVPNGEYDVRFAIYRADRTTPDAYPSDTDTALRVWAETQKVTVKSGIMNAYLGANTPFPETLTFEGGEYFLGVRVGTDSEMVPRKKFGTFTNAINAHFLGGKTTGSNEGDIATYGTGGKMDIKQLPTGTSGGKLLMANDKNFTSLISTVSGLSNDTHVQNTDIGTNSLSFNIGSGAEIGSNDFNLSVSNRGSTAPAIRYSGLTGEWQFSNDGTAFASVGVGVKDGEVLGTGMGGSVPYWTGTNTLGSENFLATSRGGTGLDTSASSGVPIISSGTWSVDSVLGVSLGGTGLTSAPSNGQLLIGNGTGFTLAKLTAGRGVAITENSGSISLAVDAITSGTTRTYFSNSGLEAVADGVRIIGGCANGQVLAWNASISAWECSDRASGTSNWTERGGTPPYTYLTDTTEDFIIGGSVLGEGFSFDVSQMAISFRGSAADSKKTTFGVVEPTVDQTLNLPDTSGVLATIDGGQTFTNATWNAGTIGVSYGGTGATSFVMNGVLYSNGTNVSSVSGTSGKILIANASGVPAFVSMSSDVTISSTGVATIQPNAIGTSEVIDSSLLAVDLKSSNVPADGQLLTYNNGTGGFTWSPVGSGGIGDITAIGDVTSSDAFTSTSTQGTSLYFYDADGRGQLTKADLTAVRTWTLPDASGTLPLGTGTTNYNAYWTATNTLGSEQYIALSRGGTNTSLTASNGGIVYSNATSLAILSGTATANQMLLSGSNTTPAWSTATYPATTTANQILYSSSANTVTGLATANSSFLATNGSGVPSMTLLSTDSFTQYALLAGRSGGQSLVGGSGVTDVLNLQGTSGNGTLTNAAINLKVGNNGATTAVSVLNNGSVRIASNLGILESTGATYYTTFQGGDQSADIAYTLPTAYPGGNGYVLTATTGGVMSWSGVGSGGIGDITSVGSCTSGDCFVDGTNNTLTFEGTTNDTSETVFGVINPTADRTLNLPDTSGVLATIDGAQTFTSATWNAGTIGVSYGGTGATSFTTNGVLYSNGTSISSVAGTSGKILVANASGVPAFVSMSSDVTLSNAGVATIQPNAIGTSEIIDNSLLAADLNVTVSPTNGQILSFDNTTGGFTWVPNDGGTGASKWTLGINYAYLSQTGYNLILGSSTVSDAPFFFDVSNDSIRFEGATNDTSETVFGVINPTADRTLNLPDTSGVLATIDGAQTFTSATWNAGTIGVSYGGTGATSFTTNGVLYSNGTSISSVAGTSGKILVANASGVPAFVSMSSDVTLSNAGVATIQPNAIGTSEIIDNSLLAADLKISNSPIDGGVLAFQSSSSGFVWNPAGSIHIGSSPVTTSSTAALVENFATNTTTDGINKYGLSVESDGSFTGSSGTATNNYGIYINTVSGGDTNYEIYDQSGASLSTAGTWTNAPSYRRYKGNYTETSSYLDRLMTLDVYEWQYKDEVIDGQNRYVDDKNRHASPFLDDFYNTFHLGTENGYNIQDLAGVALASVKELNTRFIVSNKSEDDQLGMISLKTNQQVTTLAELQTSVNQQLTTVFETENGYEIRLANLEKKTADLSGLPLRVTNLESAVSLLQSSNQALLDFYNSLSLGSVLMKNADGNLDLSGGKIRAKELSTGALSIEVVDSEAPMIGSAWLYPRGIDIKGAKDADGNDVPDGLDDATGKPVSDGKSVTVKTKAVGVGSRIFLTPKRPIVEPLAVTAVTAGKGFTVEMKNETSEEIPFDWIVVEEK